jgi:hypothetical protein
MTTNHKPIVIYWSPDYSKDTSNENWNILYSEPVQLYKELNDKREISTPAKSNILSCPASSTRFKNIYIFKNTLTTHYLFKNGEPVPQSKNYINMSIVRPPSIKNNLMVALRMNWVFFTEEDSLTMHLNPPYFNKYLYSDYGVLCSGGFDIGKWFRPIALEFNLWDNVKEFKILDEEPLFYVEFISDRPVILKRFYMSDELRSFSNSGALAVKTMGEWLPLKKRYEQFKRTKSKEIILKEIKNNLI